MKERLKISENDVKKLVRDYLNVHGIFHWHNAANVISHPGLSDRMALYRGKFYALEIKKPGGKLSANQKIFLENVEKAGGVGVVITCLEDLERVFKGEENNP